MQRSYLVLLGSLLAAALLLILLSRTESRPRARPLQATSPDTIASTGDNIGANTGANTNDGSSESTMEAMQSKRPAADVPRANVGRVLLFCAASNRGAIEAIRADYERETGRQIDVQYGASQTLLSSLEVSGAGDLYLPADASFIEIAAAKSLIAEILPLATMHAVVAVSKERPKGISQFSDLLRKDIRLVQANPDATAIGKLTREQLTARGLWEELASATTAYRTTVNEAANDVVIGAADAAIVYDAVLHTYPTLVPIQMPELESAYSRVELAVIRSSKRPAEALHFARYVAARDRGLKRYAEHGFKIESGDVWSDTPELSVFAGAMLRPAIDKTIVDFEVREGVHVSRVYNGCGILVAQMKAGQHPDVYFACDLEFMKSVPDLFPSSIDISQNELVILVQKGNPHGIRSLRDLGREGLRVGVGHEKQCAMGWLTQNTLREGKVEQEVMANVTVQSPTGDMLVNQLLAGGLDAAVAYLSNAAGAGEALDAIQIKGLACSVATQPFAIAIDSPHAQLAQRFLNRIRSVDSKGLFMAQGFKWSTDALAIGEHDH